MTRIHMMGIGGAGVSALARALLAGGDEVSGCDLKLSDTTAALAAEGAEVFAGHDPAHVQDRDLLVYSGAVASGAPEVEAARAAGLQVLTRAELLARLFAQTDSIAVAGSHGKTTVTYMLGRILTVAGWDPTVLVGDGISSRAGRGRWLVAEADESDGSLELHHPWAALVTGVDLDHPDHFRTVEEVEALFGRFLQGMPDDGLAVVCAEDPRCARLPASCRRVSYGLIAGDYRGGEGSSFPLRLGDRELGTIELRLPGRHNRLNATGAAALALEIGIPFPAVAEALADFPGAHRRLERLGSWRGASVYDDYGHHPTEVEATLQAARELGGRILLVFQPHRFSRLAALRDDFARSLEGADVVVVTEVYGAGEENPNGISAVDLAVRTPGAIFAADFEAVVWTLEGLLADGDLLLFMGAGDIGRLARELADGC